MRILLSNKSKIFLFQELKRISGAKSASALSITLGFSRGFFGTSFYSEERYLPSSLIPENLMNRLEILDQKEDNWGAVKGGKKTYETLVKKYGLNEIQKRQINGGRAAIKNRAILDNAFVMDLSNPLFLEIYGVLLGDGWLANHSYKGKKIWLIGISGDKRWDKDFYLYLKKNIFHLFKRRAYIKIRTVNNSMEINFGHKGLIKGLHRELGFPLGLKNNLSISDKVLELGYDKLRHVIRGIFDTDGSFYLDKTPAGLPYPIISIEMKEPNLIKQLCDILVERGFKVSHRIGRKKRKDVGRITLKGRRQLDKWMREIGSSNYRHLRKINGLVTQPG